MAENKSKAPSFPVGAAAKREVKLALKKATDPAEAIATFQQTHSLHSMFAKAFGTTPHYEDDEEGDTNNKNESSSSSNKKEKVDVETMDTDSVVKFLSHLGVSHNDVHKRISDTLQKELEDEIRKVTNHDALLQLLKECWHYATTLPEFRPILWAVLKQLGDQTPIAVLKALGEREKKSSRLKHEEIFKPLQPSLKRLVWETDWDSKVTIDKEQGLENPKEYLSLLQSTLLYGTVKPLVDAYCSTESLVESSSKFFVTTSLERRMITTQRRALAHSTTTSTSSGTAKTLMGKTGITSPTKPAAIVAASSSKETLMRSGKAVSRLRSVLGDTVGSAATYRPKLLHGVLSVLMAHHGAEAPKLLTASHLHCTLVADILLSSGGPLPKTYAHVHTLARVLDDAVKQGSFSDDDLVKVQSTLATIYSLEQSEDEDSSEEKPSKKKAGKGKEEDDDYSIAGGKTTAATPTTFLKRQLNRIITAGIDAMKECDPQNLFLNPVTDAIAPGYSRVIKKPICISAMEGKIDNSIYNSLEEWMGDVKLMYKNCVDYNRGQGGQWFRSEANRQLKVFKDEIFPQAKKLYQVELKRRNPLEDLKRKRQEEVEAKKVAIEPLAACSKKRKLSKEDYTLSTPALASMLLADPFVVRLLLDRVLRSLRVDVLQGSSIPAAHSVIPSVLQLLHLAEWSTQLCALRGRQYIVPDQGLAEPQAQGLQVLVPFTSLRRHIPVVLNLLIQSELDKRVAVGGDLCAVVDAADLPPDPVVETQQGTPRLQVATALLESAFVYTCAIGNSKDPSLGVSFKRCATSFEALCGNVWEEDAFFKCLVPVILRHKARLHRSIRDSIIETWLKWLSSPQTSETIKKKKKKTGSMTSSAHRHFVLLLTEWANFGNLLLPRDLLVKTTIDAIEIMNQTEVVEERKFHNMWEGQDANIFSDIKTQYERLLAQLPESHLEDFNAKAKINGVLPSADDREEAVREKNSVTTEPPTAETEAMEEG